MFMHSAGHMMNSAETTTMKAAEATDLDGELEVIASNV